MKVGPILGWLALWMSALAAGCGAPSMTMTDKQVCDSACTMLIQCAVQYDQPTCSTNCQNNAPDFLACARGAGSDCNALALCTFKQFATGCPGGVGYPGGSATCAQTAKCEGDCNVGNPTPACVCSCTAALAPAKALNSLINAQCAQARCAACHPATFDGAACDVCTAQSCASDPCFSS